MKLISLGFTALSHLSYLVWIITPVVAMLEPSKNDDEMDTDEPRTTGRTRHPPIFSPMMVLAQALPRTPDESVDSDDDVPPEVTHELRRLKVLGRPYWASSVSELMPKLLD